ncbi:MAG: hypothetical protein WC758_03060 [Candidatus Woesearchaeota archaeon]|jgi:hypothetical protein
MNKRGVEGIKLSLYFIGELLAGVLILVFFVLVIPKLMLGSAEDIMAKDIALTIMTISASPSDMVLKYAENTENYQIKITQDEVQVFSKEGSGKYKYFPMRGIKIEPAIIKDTVTLPMTLKNSVIYFRDDLQDFTDSCSDFPNTFSDELTFNRNLYVKIIVSPDETGDTKIALENIKRGIEQKAGSDPNSQIRVFDFGEDIILILKTSSGNTLNTKYYQDINDPQTAGFRRVSCYIEDELKNKHVDKFKDSKSESSSEKNTISIDFGDPKNLIDTENVAAIFSKEIYNSISISIKD